MELFRTKGLEPTTMESIASAAGVTKRTLYLHFPSKESIASAFLLAGLRNKVAMLPQLLEQHATTEARIDAVFQDAAEGFESQPDLALAHFSHQFAQLSGLRRKPPQLCDDFTTFLAAILDAGQKQGEVRRDVTAHELAVYLMMQFTAACLTWFADASAEPLGARLRRARVVFFGGANLMRDGV
jgi:AcrR family transcriptional regulator